MRRDTLTAFAALAFTGMLAFPTVADDRPANNTAFAISAICRAERYAGTAGSSARITIERGMGDGGFAIATASRPAQQWFNYGIKLFHAFYHQDSRQAFDNAVAADSRCALCLWGQALSRGPTANFDAEPDDLKAGLDMARRAEGLARTAREKILTSALAKRYSRDQDAAAERDFAAELLKGEAAGSPAADLRSLAAEVLLGAWRRGDHDAAAAAIDFLEPVLRQSPDNTGAIHYYIHATEFAGKPGLALAYAEKLSRLAPKASHLVHMAAHTYFHIGRYQDAATINAFALGIDADHLKDTASPVSVVEADYYGHNLGFGMAGALMSGDRALALRFADHVHRVYSERAFHSDGMSALEGRRLVIYARYDPARLLALPEPTADNPKTRALYHYARGEAYAMRRDGAGVAREVALVTGDDPLLVVARGVLAGRLAMLQGRYAQAAASFEAAAHQQETVLASSFDPPPWWYPIRRSAAAAWLQAGQPARAMQAAQASLAAWPTDPMALLVRARAEDALGQVADARHDNATAIGTWEGDIGKVDIATL